MANLEHYKTRRTCRKFKPEQITDEELDAVLEAGLYAASGMNRQCVVAVAIQKSAIRNTLAKINAAVMNSTADPFYGAPTVIAVLADSNFPTYIEDGSLVLGNMMNAAHELGLGSGWIHRAKEEFENPIGKRIIEELDIPEGYVGIGNLILGYSDEGEKEIPERKVDRVFKI